MVNMQHSINHAIRASLSYFFQAPGTLNRKDAQDIIESYAEVAEKNRPPYLLTGERYTNRISIGEI